MGKPKSIVQLRKECYLCREWGFRRNTDKLELHHVFPGNGTREISDKTGCVVWLCREHHTGAGGVHRDNVAAAYVQWHTQSAYEQLYGHEDFMDKFGIDYKAKKTRYLDREGLM